MAIISRVLRNRPLYMSLLRRANCLKGVHFECKPRFIHPNAVLDAAAKFILGNNIVIPTGVLVLTHDYSYTT